MSKHEEFSHRTFTEEDDFRYKNYTRCSFYLCTFKNVDLTGARFYGCQLAHCRFIDCNMFTCTVFCQSSLHSVQFRDCDLGMTSFAASELIDVDVCPNSKLAWQSHELLGHLLLNRSGKVVERQMLAAFISKVRNYCWKDYLKMDHPEKEWALNVLREWKGCPADFVRFRDQVDT